MPDAFFRFVAASARSMLALVLCVPCLSAQGIGAKIEGVVTDSLRGGPLVGALVVATPAAGVHDTVFHAAQTDERGRFVLANLRSGAYALSVEHPVIDSTGIGAPTVAVNVADDQTANASLAIPSGTTLRRALCATFRDARLGVIAGSVRHAGGRPASDAVVVVSWMDFEVDSGSARVLSFQVDSSVHTDANGAYRACGLPVERSLFVQAKAGNDVQSGMLEELIGRSGVLVRDYQIGSVARENGGTSSASALSGFSLSGTVTTLDDRPIASAQVMLLGGTGSVATNDRGEFRIVDISPGTQGARVLALGYYPRALRVDPVSGETSVIIKMENAAVVLDSMRVIAKRTGTRSRYTAREFDQRKLHSVGTYLDEDQIVAMGPVVTTDIFRHLAGVRVIAMKGTGTEILVSPRGTVTFQGQATICPMDVYLDGMRVTSDDIRMVSPSMLHGIEVHSAATGPTAYRVGSCGAVFLWTR